MRILILKCLFSQAEKNNLKIINGWFIEAVRIIYIFRPAFSSTQRHPVQYIFLLLIIPLSVHCVRIQTAAPYPLSSIITDVTFDWSTHKEYAPGSDNWPVTWADNDHQYSAWGDGGGFNGTNSDGRVSLGVARIEGSWDNYLGYNVWGGKNPENPAQFGGKSYGILSLQGILYMWVSPGSDATNYDEARLASSSDYGATWSKVDWAFTKSDDLVLPTILQFGKDYCGSRDDYVYHYAIRLKNGSSLSIQKPGQIDLMRVPKDDILNRNVYQFFAGIDDNRNPTWTNDLSARVPVFEDTNGVGWNVSVTYNNGLGRYVLATEHTESMVGNLGLFDAPQPWGPWTTIGYYNNWEGKGSNFFWNFSNKWTSTDGKDFTLIFTGTVGNDSWNSVRGKFSTTPRSQNLHYLPVIISWEKRQVS